MGQFQSAREPVRNPLIQRHRRRRFIGRCRRRRIAAGRAEIDRRRPQLDELEVAVQKSLTAGKAFDLAASRAGDSARPHQTDDIQAYFVLFEHGLANGGDRGGTVDWRRASATHFLNEHRPARGRCAGWRRRRRRWAARRAARLSREFDILWIMIAAANDDQFLDPAGDIQLAAVEYAQVAGEERARGGINRPSRKDSALSSGRFQ